MINHYNSKPTVPFQKFKYSSSGQECVKATLHVSVVCSILASIVQAATHLFLLFVGCFFVFDQLQIFRLCIEYCFPSQAISS